MTMLSDGVLLSGGGNEIKAWDSLMRFKLIKERVVSPLRLCHRHTLLTCRSASINQSINILFYVCSRRGDIRHRSASSVSPSDIVHVSLCLVCVTVRLCSRVALLRLCHRQTLLTSRAAHCVSHFKGEPSPTSRSFTVLIRTFERDYKPRVPVCICMQKDHIDTLKIQ